MGKFSDVLKSGALGIGTAVLARNPKMLRGFGALGNVAANQIENREEDKKRAQSAATAPTPQNETPMVEENPQKLFKKGGKVKSASARADGCAVRGKTKGRMV
jgi:hypothetical protein